jgi:hypothetical protein
MMTCSKRRRGAQPGNHNALKHGLYRGKPTACTRKRGPQPGNLNRLVHARYSSIARPEATARPEASSIPRSSLSTQIASFEVQMLDLLEEPGCDPVDLAARLHALNIQLIALLRLVEENYPFDLYKPERKLP